MVSKSTKFYNNIVAKLIRYAPSNLRLLEEIRSRKDRGRATVLDIIDVPGGSMS